MGDVAHTSGFELYLAEKSTVVILTAWLAVLLICAVDCMLGHLQRVSNNNNKILSEIAELITKFNQ